MSFPPFATHISHPSPHGGPPLVSHHHPRHAHASSSLDSREMGSILSSPFHSSATDPMHFSVLPSISLTPLTATTISSSSSSIRYRDSYIKKSVQSNHSLATLHSSSNLTKKNKIKFIDKVTSHASHSMLKSPKKVSSLTDTSSSNRRHSLPVSGFSFSHSSSNQDTHLVLPHSIATLNEIKPKSTSVFNFKDHASSPEEVLRSNKHGLIKNKKDSCSDSLLNDAPTTSSSTTLASSSSSNIPLTTVMEEPTLDPSINIHTGLKGALNHASSLTSVSIPKKSPQPNGLNSKSSLNSIEKRNLTPSLMTSTDPETLTSLLTPPPFTMNSSISTIETVLSTPLIDTATAIPSQPSDPRNTLNVRSSENLPLSSLTSTSSASYLHVHPSPTSSSPSKSLSPPQLLSTYNSKQEPCISNPSLHLPEVPCSSSTPTLSIPGLTPSSATDLLSTLTLQSLSQVTCLGNDPSTMESPTSMADPVPPLAPPSDPPDLLLSISYPPTQLQQFMFVACNPTEDPSLHLPKPTLSLSIYQMEQDLDMRLFSVLFHRFLLMHPILLTRFSTNPKIVDSDIDAHIQMTVDVPTFLQVLPHVFPSDAQKYVLKERASMSPLAFKLFVQPLQHQTFFYVVLSPALGDELSADVMMCFLIHVYTLVQKELKSPGSYPSSFSSSSSSTSTLNVSPILNFPLKEIEEIAVHPLFWQKHFGQPHVDFIEYAEDEAATSNTKREQSLIYFKSQVIASKQEYVDFMERRQLEQTVHNYTVDIKNQEAQLQALVNRMASYEIEWTQAETNRRKLELAKHEHPTVVFHEDGEAICVSLETMHAIEKTLFQGDHVTDLPSLLQKQGLRHVEPFLHMSWPDFADLSESQCITLAASVQEKRRLLNCIEYVRNRVKETLQEMAKLKFQYEKKCLRYKRDLHTLRLQLESQRSNLDKLKHLLLKTNVKLHPPLEFEIFSMAQLPFSSSSSSSMAPCPREYFGFPLNNEARLHKLSRYAREICKLDTHASIPILNTTPLLDKHNDVMSSVKSTSSEWMKEKEREHKHVEGDHVKENTNDVDDDDDNGDDDEEDEQKMHVFLALFSILIKHIIGLETFVIGLKLNQRRTRLHQGIGIGPLTTLVPFRVDLSDLNQSLSQFVRSISMQATTMKLRAMHLAADALLYHDIHMDMTMKRENGEVNAKTASASASSSSFSLPRIQFEWMSYDDYHFLHKHYHYAPDFFLDDVLTSSNILMKTKWNDVSTTFDFLFRCMAIEKGKYHSGFYYPSMAPIQRWTEKFQFLLENIDIQQRHVSIATVIGRFYHSAWSVGSSSLNSLGNTSLGSITELRQSVAALMKEDAEGGRETE
ncbi:hypothetical protein HMI54_014540 [Coelomomyces lativittatus]|nr:hypothetical protein HMI56_002699 [Coelomomyces lativittatus]KAJ1514022.1 hypothetical protein HMI54_014540 [Coelomomyces lativittatus]KAJ1518322.1 hypothetical protein HMI55_007143 [Coelomomyces lativittatus]